jgi:hypothetical protein
VFLAKFPPALLAGKEEVLDKSIGGLASNVQNLFLLFIYLYDDSINPAYQKGRSERPLPTVYQKLRSVLKRKLMYTG